MSTPFPGRLLQLLALIAAAGLAACGSNSSGAVTVAIAPQSATVATMGEAQFSAAVGGSNNTQVTWSVQEGITGGTITQGGAYTAPSSPGTYHVVATSQADTSRGGIATVIVSEGLALTITLNETSATLLEGGTQQFTATVSGATDTTVSWSVLEGVPGGSVSSTGLYTAPANAGTFHVVATANADSTKSASAAVAVEAPPAVVSLAIDPTTAAVNARGTLPFSARVTGSSNTAVTWSVEESGGGAIDASGVYTAPNAGGTFHVLATSAADTTKTAEATVTVAAPALIGISVSPSTAAIAAGAQQQLIATVSNSANTAVSWSVDESGAGSVDGNGLYTAPPLGGTYHVRATSAADTTKSASAAITVSPPPAITIVVTPGTSTIPANAQVQFTAGVSNATSTAVTWSVDESSGGSITLGGLYTAPPAAGPFHVRATSTVDTHAFGEATVTVTAPSAVTVGISPAAVTVAASAQQQFTASVANGSTTAVTWSIDENGGGSLGGGSITLGGLYSAPSAGGTFHVRATSVADNSKSAAATVTVTPPSAITVAVSPNAPSIAADGQQQFSATVSNASVTSVTWSVDEIGSGGSVSTAGLYTAPHAAGTFHVRATSTADTSKSAAATVTVLAPAPVTVALTPLTVSLAADAQQQFVATVTNAPGNNGVTWSVDETAAGTVISGLYTAPHLAGTFHVRATSVADSSKFAEATVTVAAPPPVAISVSPTIAYLQTGTGWQFGATVSNATDTSVAWTVVGGAPNGTITSGGYYTAPPTTPGSFTVKATSNADSTKSATATAVVTTTPPNVVVTVGPAAPFVATHGTIQLTATVTGTTNSAVVWSVPSGSTAGSIDPSSGLYTAPASAGTYTVRATSVANGAVYGQINVRVDTVTVTVSPTTKTLPQGGSQTFTATVTIGNGDPLPTTVTWSVLEGQPASGTVGTSSGVYTTPPSSPLTAHVVATSTADPNISASAVVTVIAPIAPPPTNLVATSGNGSVTLTWSSATGATTYNVYFAAHGALATSSVAELVGATSGVVVRGLNNGQAYDFVVTSVNTGGESGDSSVVTATPGDMSAPGVAAVFPLPGAIGVPLAVTPYIEFTKLMNNATLAPAFTVTNNGVAVQGSVSFDGARAIFTPTVPLNARTAYVAKVTSTAHDAQGNALQGFQWTFTTQAESTDAVHVLLGESAITLSWDAVPGASYYTIYRGTVSGGPYLPIYSTAGLSFTDNTSRNGTTYYYVITATTASGEGAASDEVQGAPSNLLPDPPSGVPPGGLQAFAGNKQVVLTWPSAGANLTYNIFRATASGGPYTLITTSGNSLGYVDNDNTLVNGTTYYYVIRSIDTHQNSSANSVEVNATPSAAIIAAPTWILDSNGRPVNGNNFVGLNWNPVANATGYVVFSTTTYGGPYSPLYAVGPAVTSFVDTSARNNTTYFYVVAAVDANGNIGTYSTAVEGDPANYALTLAPVLSSQPAYNGHVLLNWTTAPGATKYSINRDGTTIATNGGQTSYTDNNLNNNAHTYYVTAINSNSGATAASNSITVTPTTVASLAAFTNVKANAGVSSVSLTWDAIPGATSYTVNYGVSPGTYTTGSTSNTTYPLAIFTGLANSSPFYFQLIATGPDTQGNTLTVSTGSSYAATATPLAINLPPQPTGVSSVVGAGTISIFWSPVVVPDNPATNPVRFNIWRTVGLSNWTKLNAQPTLQTGYVDNTVTNGVGYYYAIETVFDTSGGNGTNIITGPWSSPTSQLFPNAADPQPPTNIVVHPGNNYATLSWNAQPSVTSYSIYSSAQPGGPYSYVAGPSTYPSWTGQVSNQTPTYFVLRSSMPNAPAQSALSAEVVINTSSNFPVPASASAVAGNGQIELNWASVAKATSFNIYRTSGLSTWQLIGSTPSTRTGYIDSGLTDEDEYYYAVASVGIAGEAAWSNIVSSSPRYRQPPAPSNLAVVPGNGAATLTWNSIPGAYYYGVYTSAISGGPYSIYNYVYSNAYSLTNLGNDTPVYVVVEVYNNAESVSSGYSAEVTVLPTGTLLSPSRFGSTTIGFDGLYLNWTAVAGATGYHLYRANYYSNNQAAVWSLLTSTTTNYYSDADVQNGVSYEYAVAPVSGTTEGPWVFSSSATPSATAPLPPGNLSFQPGNTYGTLTWDAVPGATYYYVDYSSTPGGPYSGYNTTTTPALTVSLSNSAPTYYVVQTYNGTSYSGYSQEFSGTGASGLPAFPGVSTPTKGSGQLNLTWGNVAGANSYLIYRYSPGAVRWTLVGQSPINSYADTTVQTGTAYQYSVAAANGVGVGPWSSPTTAVTF